MFSAGRALLQLTRSTARSAECVQTAIIVRDFSAAFPLGDVEHGWEAAL